MNKLFKRLALVGATLLLIFGSTFAYVHFQTKHADSEALKLIEEADNITMNGDDYVFQSAPQANIIFYTGAFIENSAYVRLAENLSIMGYKVHLMSSPFNFPLLNGNQAYELIEKQNLSNVYLAGHSLGGTVAAKNLADYAGNSAIKGLILLASYPSRTTSLKDLDLPVLSITASEDGVINQTKYESRKANLNPETTSYYTIQGGNHAGFGQYGVQKGDGAATLTTSQQQQETAQVIDQFIKSQTQ